jgi:predicted GNAT family acetyltransferase
MRESMPTRLRDYYRTHLNKDFFAAFVEQDGAVVAVAFLTVGEMPANVFTPTGKYGTILNVLTYPEHRKKGYATQALELLIDKAQDEDLSFLQLSASDMGKSVYERLGFKPDEKAGFTNMRLLLV